MNFSLALRLLLRDWRAGELRVLFLALLLAVASITSVGFFTGRIAQALQHQSNELLGADIVVSADHPISDNFISEADKLGLQHIQAVEFPTMLLSDTESSLVMLKAVDNAYPLRGHLEISRKRFAAGVANTSIPVRGSIWVASALLTKLDVNIGDVLTVGEAQLTISAVIINDPVIAAGSFFNVAPGVVINSADLLLTALVKETSRVRFKLLVAGPFKTVQVYRDSLELKLGFGERLESVEDARPEIRAALQRADRYLGLASLVSVLLASVAIATSARRYTRRQLSSCALMRCVGAVQKQVMSLYLMQLLMIALSASAMGCLLGYLLQYGLVAIFSSLFDVSLSSLSMTAALMPIGAGMLTGVLILFGFAAPALLQLKNVPVLSILRCELGKLPAVGLSIYISGFVVFALLLFWQAGDFRLALMVLAGIVFTVLILMSCAGVLIKILKIFLRKLNTRSMLGLSGLTRRSVSSTVQITAFGVGIMVLLLLTLVRNELISGWQNTLPTDAPNRFLINIQTSQLPGLRTLLDDLGFERAVFYPMVKGRLTDINGVNVAAVNFHEQRAAGLIEREFNLSWAETMPVDNFSVAGSWWQPSSKQSQVSLEEGLAKTLGLGLGDVLTFAVAGKNVDVKIVHLREVDWDSFQVNFYALMPAQVLSDFPVSYISSIFVPEDRNEMLDTVVRSYPNITVIDVSKIMSRVRAIIERVSMAIEYVFLLTLVAGFLVMYAAIFATLDERLHEVTIMKVLGASHSKLRRALLLEFVVLGTLSGLVAAICADFLGYGLASFSLHVDYALNPFMWLFGMLAGALGVSVAGMLGTRSVLTQSPISSLRAAS